MQSLVHPKGRGRPAVFWATLATASWRGEGERGRRREGGGLLSPLPLGGLPSERSLLNTPGEGLQPLAAQRLLAGWYPPPLLSPHRPLIHISHQRKVGGEGSRIYLKKATDWLPASWTPLMHHGSPPCGRAGPTPPPSPGGRGALGLEKGCLSGDLRPYKQRGGAHLGGALPGLPGGAVPPTPTPTKVPEFSPSDRGGDYAVGRDGKYAKIMRGTKKQLKRIDLRGLEN